MAARRDLETRVVTTGADQAARELDKVADSAERIERLPDPTIEVSADDKASGDLDRVADQARALDGEEARVRVTAPGVDDLMDKLGDLPGPLGKVGGSLGDIAGVMGKGGAIVGGVTALAGGLMEAANHAADLAVEAQTTAELTGDSTEDASRLQAVWRTTGADVNDLNDVLLQMNGVLQTNPQLVQQLGINLQDGRTIGQRFVQVLQELNNYSGDAASKAQLMSQAFGEEGVRQVAKLTSLVGDDLVGALEDVSDAQVFTSDEVNTALEMKRATAELNSQMQALSVELGQAVIPALTQAVNLVEQLKVPEVLQAGVGQVTTGLGEWLSGFSGIRKQIGYITGSEVTGHVADDLYDASKATQEAEASTADYNAAVEQITQAQQDYLAAVEDMREGFQHYVDGAKELVEINDQIVDSWRSAADSGFALRDAQRDFAKQLDEWNELTGPESEATMADLAEAMDNAAQGAGKIADTAVRIAQEQAKANGVTLTATQSQHKWTESMVDSARQATGPLRSAIVSYIAKVNGIPERRVSRILADTADDTVREASNKLNAVADKRRQAKIDARIGRNDAEGSLNHTARGRTSGVTQYAHTADAEADLNYTARERTAIINTVARVAGGIANPFGGGMAGAIANPGGEVMWVGEAGPELVQLPGGARVYPHAQSVGMAQRAAGGNTATITINTAVIGNRFDVQRTVRQALKESTRLNGSRPYR